MSAQIIPLPGAATQPVQQKNGPGRRPRHSNIIGAYRWHFGHARPKASKEAHQAALQSELQYAHKYFQTCERIYQDARSQFLLAQQRAKNGSAA